MVPSETGRNEGAIDHDGWMLDRGTEEGKLVDIVVLGGKGFETGEMALIVDGGALAANNDGIGMSTEIMELASEAVRVHDVIGIYAGQVLAAGKANGAVERGGNATVFGVGVDADAGVYVGVVAENVERVVGGGVVDSDEFPVGVGLGEDAVEADTKILPGVVDGQEDGNGGEGRGGHTNFNSQPRLWAKVSTAPLFWFPPVEVREGAVL